MALGAPSAAALWVIVRDAAVMIGVGTSLSLPAVFPHERVVEAQLFGVSGLHVPTIALAGLVLIAVSLSAAMPPAWRAAVNSAKALRL